ncbi:efflux RND transporter periplasmic adaptor subunit [Saccharibacter floricola]|uniref:Cation efflux system protein CzcB n=1 Tax=Saccharibacter floricola DSM 15669 TaxID=1123227 RepID=A0ABQ0NX12_9PROT|nr:efflux RND transporter periplasmic adaptor subunit [Saccharibacter floricola]GBQ05081.1 cation efflux system protein CzcB [Saccharibacter floricola DSM 15669]
MRASRSLITLIVLFLLIVLGGWQFWRFTHHPHEVSPEAPMVTQDGDTLRVRVGSPLHKRLIIEPVTLSASPHHIELPAQVIAVPGRSINIYTPVSGRVADIHVQPGQTVQKGDVLAVLYSGDLAQAWSDQRKAQATLALTRKAYRRATAVLSAGGNAVKDMQSAQNDLEQAQAEAHRAQERLQALGASSAEGYQPIIAPFTGTIGTVSIGVGQNVTDPTSALMTLVDTQDVWISASVPESMLSELRPTMTLSAPFDGQTCSGPITTRDPTLRTDTRRLNLYLRCSNAQGMLRPGQFTTASLSIPSQTYLQIPKTALLMNNDEVSVFVETAANVYRRRTVGIRYDEGDNVSVLSGLSNHDRIITHGAILLNDN